MDKFISSLQLTDVIQALLSFLSVCATGYLGYRIAITKQKGDNVLVRKSAEEEFRDDLIQQLEDTNKRLDREREKLEHRDKKVNELLELIDNLWKERSDLRLRISSLESELLVCQRKIQDLTFELQKFERKVFYIPKENV